MATASNTLSDADLAALLLLIKDADSVELKLTVPDPDHRSTIGALRMDPLQAQIRQVFFFDTPDLKLDRAGVVVRARRIQGRDDDSVVKLRPVVPTELPAALRRSPNFVVEVDAPPGAFVCSGSLRCGPGLHGGHAAAARTHPVRRLFSKEQRQLFEAHAPAGVELDQLSVLRPVFVLKLKLRPPELRRKLVAEMWLYPDGSRILELSTKC